MTTKDDCLSFKDKQNVFVDTVFNNQFSNLNLNQNRKCVYKSLRSKSVTTGNKKVQNYALSNPSDFTTTDNFSKNDSNSWNKSKKHLKSSFFNIDQTSDEKDEFKKSKSANNSTLSLHIAAYENSIEATNESDGCEKEVETLSMVKKWGNLNHRTCLTPNILNPFEIPRQQEHQGNPEVMQFKASQRLRNLNEESSPGSAENTAVGL
uniref:Uncharacterized protein n=1 Tax=Panagrolaimus superbus TaxID=310955 RepID=A0A914YPB6_9BILA